MQPRDAVLPKSSVEWECYRAGQIPAPGDYYVDDLLDNIKGSGRMQPREAVPSKSGVEWDMYRASQIPGPADYDVQTAIDVMDGRAGHNQKQSTMHGRTAPGVMPFPYERCAMPVSATRLCEGALLDQNLPTVRFNLLSRLSAHERRPQGSASVKRGPSASHERSLTPWRDPDWPQRKAEAGQALGVTQEKDAAAATFAVRPTAAAAAAHAAAEKDGRSAQQAV